MVDQAANHCMEKRISSSQEAEVRKGPWTMEEDLILINYIANHGEGVWNALAKSAGLKRTGKSCRLRWLNYLRPDVRRGNITPEEQFIIMDLHSRWGNKWSKIARQLPGRTDNEIKNYWRTRIQKKPTKQSEPFNDYQNMQSMMVDVVGSAGTSHSNVVETGMAPQPSYVQMQYPDNANIVDDAFAAAPSFAMSTDLVENFWTVEDYWTMQPIINGD